MGLPNIIGMTGSTVENASSTGAFYSLGRGSWLGGGSYGTIINGFDASRSNSIYGSSSTITPLSQSALILVKY